MIPTETVFHGIVPGKSAKPIGKIYIEVAFGTVEIFCSEIMPFEVVDLKSPYHDLFGRPAYFKFMARPCYIYLKLKMPGPAGVFSVGSAPVPGAVGVEELGAVDGAPAISCEGRPKFMTGGVSGATLLFSKS